MEFETEEQQVEAIKKWFKEYGTTIAAGLILGLIGIFGFRYINEQRELSKGKTSDDYEAVMVILNDQKDNQKFISEAVSFKKENADSIYSNLISFQLAKLAVDETDLGTAAQHLKDILANAQHSTIEHIARIRLLRILIALNETEEALALIANVVGDEYSSSYEMLRGDIWLAKGDRNRARQAYTAAKTQGAEGPTAPNLEMLLIDLAEETAELDAG